QIETRELFLRLCERAIGNRNLTVPDPHRRGGLDRLKRFGGYEESALPEPRSAGHAFAVRHRVQLLIFEVDEAQILHHAPYPGPTHIIGPAHSSIPHAPNRQRVDSFRQLGEAPLEKTPLRLLPRERDGPPVRGAGFGVPSK